MTFDGWFEGKDCDGACYIFAEAAWNAGQAAEREKYAELIAAAEAVIKQWEPPVCPVIYRLLDVIERMKNED